MSLARFSFRFIFATAFGLSFGLAAVRNLPRLTFPAPQAAALLVLIALYLAFRAGRDYRRGEWEERVTAAIADARATAIAEVQTFATSQASVNVHLGQPKATDDHYDLAEAVEVFAEEGDLQLDQEEVAQLLGLPAPVSNANGATYDASHRAAGQPSAARAELSGNHDGPRFSPRSGEVAAVTWLPSATTTADDPDKEGGPALTR